MHLVKINQSHFCKAIKWQKHFSDTINRIGQPAFLLLDLNCLASVCLAIVKLEEVSVQSRMIPSAAVNAIFQEIADSEKLNLPNDNEISDSAIECSDIATNVETNGNENDSEDEENSLGET